MNSRRGSHMPRVGEAPSQPLPPGHPAGPTYAVHPSTGLLHAIDQATGMVHPHPLPPGHPAYGHPPAPPGHARRPASPAIRGRKSLRAVTKPVDEIRWGDQQSFKLGPGPGASQQATNQLVNIMVNHPETYTVLLVARIVQLNVGTGLLNNVIIVRWDVNTGAGSAQIDFTGQEGVPGGSLLGRELEFVFDAGATSVTEDYLVLTTPYLVAFRSIILPSKQLLVTMPGIQLHTANPDATATVQIAAFAAPRVYQSGAAQEPDATDETDDTTATEWMGPGFTPEPLHYK